MISLRQITYALAVGRMLHFKQAADACAVSPSALSTAITEMERQLGFTLFERDNKKVLVTTRGKEVLEKFHSIKLQVDDLDKLSYSGQEPLSYPLSIGIIPTIGPYLLPKVLPALNHKYPALQLTIIEEESQVLLEMLRRGELDTAILALPFRLDGLLSFTFWEEDFYWITHRDDVQANKSEVAASELDTSKLMLLKEGHCLKDHALAACKLTQDAHHSFSSSSLYTLVQLVAGKMGTTLVPQMALGQLLAANDVLVKAHLNEPGPHRKIAFVTRPNYVGVDDLEALMALFKQELANHT